MTRLGYARAATVVSLIAIVWQTFTLRLVSGWLALLPAGVFVVLVVYHQKQRNSWKRAKLAVAFYERGIARLENRWQGHGARGTEYGTPGHLYATDLDILGDASLFELVCTATTRSGEETLARWLCAPASRQEILERQQAVHELRNALDLREDLSVIGADVRARVDREFITKWAKARSPLNSLVPAIIAAGLVGVLLATAIYSLVFGGDALLPISVLFFEAVFGLFMRPRVLAVIQAIDEPVRELRVLGLALERIEKESYKSAKIRSLQAGFEYEERRPSAEIARLGKLVDYLNQRRNQFFAPIAAALLWGTQFAFVIEAWRRRCGPRIEGWLENFGEFEALCALAGYAYEHPDDPFPEIAESGVVFEGQDLRHPLVPVASCVPNSIRLGGDLQLLLVSGSNMSGKSTLLRTVGINTVLALAGGPVRARRLRLSIVNMGATLRVQDSLQAGVSSFYAEVQRLRDTMELTARSIPVLFLLDEILHGTNSHDRAIGAEAIVRGLLERGAIGLVTTHDLALTRVAEELGARAMNVHFQDQLLNGKMTFDYVLHPGVVTKSNALELMRAVGLEV